MDIQRLILRLMADASQYHRTLNNVVRDTSSSVTSVVKAFSSGTAAMVRNIASGARTIGTQWNAVFTNMANTATKTFGVVAQAGARSYFRGGSGGGGTGGGMFAGTVGTIMQLTTAVVALTGAAKGLDVLKDAARTAVELAADYQDAAVAFEVMTGSAEKGAKLQKDLEKFAVATPFSQKDVIENAKQLTAFGVAAEDILPTMKALGDVTAGVGGGTEKFQRLAYNLGQVVAQGHATGTDIRQFAMAGVGIENFAKAAGKTVPEFQAMVSAGEASSEIILKAFNQMTGEGGKFENLMGRMSGNIRPQWNAIKESISLGLRDIGKSFFEALEGSGVGTEVMSMVQEFREAAPEIGKSLASAFSNGRQAIIGVRVMFDDIWDILKNMNATAKDFFDLFGVGDITFMDFLTGLTAIPAELKSLFYAARAGLYEYMLIPVTKLIDAVHAGIAKITPGNSAGYDAGFYQAIIQGFQGQVDMDKAKTPIDDWAKNVKKRMDEVKKATSGAKDELDKIGKIKIPEVQFPADVKKFLDELSTGSTERHGGPFENIFRKMEGLAKAANTNISDPNFPLHPKNLLMGKWLGPGGQIELQKIYGFGAGKLLDELRSAVGGGEDRLPGFTLRGSQEAQDIINRSSQEQLTVAQEMKMLLERANILQEERLKYEKEAAAALDEMRKRGIIKGRI